MSDSDNKINNDVDEINVTDRPTDKSGRSSDIYERFITRVQSINSDSSNNDSADNASPPINKKVLDEANMLAGFEPLSDEELGFFLADDDSFVHSDTPDDLNPNEPSINELNTDLDVNLNTDNEVSENISNAPADDNTDIENHKNNAASVAHAIPADTPNPQSKPPFDKSVTTHHTINKTDKKADDKKQWRQRKSGASLVIIGVVIALGLSAIILVALSATGQLPQFNNIVEETESGRHDAAATSHRTAHDQSETLHTVSEPAAMNPIVDTDTGTEKNSPTPVAVPAQSNRQNITEISTKKQPNNDNANNDNTAQNTQMNSSSISVDEFHEEAQNTLYRETK